MEWALKYFTSAEAISLPTLVNAIFNGTASVLTNRGLPCRACVRATVLYGLAPSASLGWHTTFGRV